MDRLVERQVELNGRINRAIDNLRKLGGANITKGAVTSRVEALQNNWSKFQANHEKICEMADESKSKIPYFKNDYLGETEEVFLEQKGKFLDILENYSETITDPPAITSVSESHPRNQLPRIDLPKFSGNYSDWTNFRDLFEALIKSNASLTNVVRLHYLKMSLTGEPAQLLKNLSTTGDNFARAWNLMTERYENKRLLVTSHLAALCSIQSLTTESASGLKLLINGTSDAINALQMLNRPVDFWSDWLVHITVQRLDLQSRRDWETSVGSSLEPPTFDELKTFIETRIRALEALEQTSIIATNKQMSSSSTKSSKLPSAGGISSVKAHHVVKKKSAASKCSLCQQNHFLIFCEAFRAKSPESRKNLVVEKDLCINCLGSHQVKDCWSSKVCQNCKGRHHTMLHEACSSSQPDSYQPATTSGKPSIQHDSSASNQSRSVTTHLMQMSPCNPIPVLLATNRLYVNSSHGEKHLARALIDQGSEVSFITESLAQRLHLSRRSATLPVIGIGAKSSSTTRGAVTLEISSRLNSTATCTAEALVLPKLTAYVPKCQLYKTEWPHLQGLPLADPEFSASDHIDVLLGADIYALIIEEGLRKGPEGTPIAQQSTLGWILSGRMSSDGPPSNLAESSITSLQCSVDNQLNSILQRFWEQEEVSQVTAPPTDEELECESHFQSTHYRNPKGRYVVRLPLKSNFDTIGDSFTPAARMLQRMERRFERESQLYQSYSSFMMEYEELGHMQLAPTLDTAGDQRHFYLPHHGVVKESSTTTKLRVVFNGSQKTNRNVSLNEFLHVGPKLLPDLSDVLLRWRLHAIVFSADITKMYRQILVHPADIDLQRIL